MSSATAHSTSGMTLIPWDYFHLHARWINASKSSDALLNVTAYMARERDCDLKQNSLQRVQDYMSREPVSIVDDRFFFSQSPLSRDETWRAITDKARRKDGEFSQRAGHMPRLATFVDIRFPWPLSDEADRQIARDFAETLVRETGCCVEVALHIDPKRGRICHGHFLISDRIIDANGVGEKIRSMNGIHSRKSNLGVHDGDAYVAPHIERMRSLFADLCRGYGVEVDHRSYCRQGKPYKAFSYVLDSIISGQQKAGEEFWRIDRAEEARHRIAALQQPLEPSPSMAPSRRRTSRTVSLFQRIADAVFSRAADPGTLRGFSAASRLAAALSLANSDKRDKALEAEPATASQRSTRNSQQSLVSRASDKIFSRAGTLPSALGSFSPFVRFASASMALSLANFDKRDKALEAEPATASQRSTRNSQQSLVSRASDKIFSRAGTLPSALGSFSPFVRFASASMALSLANFDKRDKALEAEPATASQRSTRNSQQSLVSRASDKIFSRAGTLPSALGSFSPFIRFASASTLAHRTYFAPRPETVTHSVGGSIFPKPEATIAEQSDAASRSLLAIQDILQQADDRRLHEQQRHLAEVAKKRAREAASSLGLSRPSPAVCPAPVAAPIPLREETSPAQSTGDKFVSQRNQPPIVDTRAHDVSKEEKRAERNATDISHEEKATQPKAEQGAIPSSERPGRSARNDTELTRAVKVEAIKPSRPREEGALSGALPSEDKVRLVVAYAYSLAKRHRNKEHWLDELAASIGLDREALMQRVNRFSLPTDAHKGFVRATIEEIKVAGESELHARVLGYEEELKLDRQRQNSNSVSKAAETTQVQVPFDEPLRRPSAPPNSVAKDKTTSFKIPEGSSTATIQPQEQITSPSLKEVKLKVISYAALFHQRKCLWGDVAHQLARLVSMSPTDFLKAVEFFGSHNTIANPSKFIANVEEWSHTFNQTEFLSIQQIQKTQLEKRGIKTFAIAARNDKGRG